MTMEEARALVAGPLWPMVRDSFLSTGEFCVYPTGDMRRIGYLDGETRRSIELWKEALAKADGWKKIVSGEEVRSLRAAYPGVYPEVFRYQIYFSRWQEEIAAGAFPDGAMRQLLRLRFPDALALLDA